MLQSILRRTALVLVGGGLSKVVLLGFEFWFAATRGPAEYGLFAICLTLLILVSSLSLLSLDYATVQYLAIHQEQRDKDRVAGVLLTALLVFVLTGLGAAFLLAGTAGFLAERVFHKPALEPLFRVLAIAIPFETLNQGMASMFRGLRQFRFHIVVSDLCRNAGLVLSLPALVLFDASIQGVVLLAGAGAAAATVIGLRQLRPYLAGVRWTEVVTVATFRKLLGFSYLLFVWNILQKLSGRTQLLIAGMFLSAGDVGLLGVLLRLPLLFVIVQSALNYVVPVEFARLNHLQDRPELQRVLRGVTHGLLTVSLVIAIGMLVQPEGVLGLFGGEYRRVALLLIPLVAVQVINVGTGPVGHVLVSCSKQPAMLLAASISTATQIGLSVLLLPVWGLLGAVVAEVTTVATLTGVKHVLLWRLLRLHVFDRRLLATGGVGLLCVLAGFTGVRFTGGAAGPPVAAFVSVLLYLTLLRRYGLISIDWRWLVGRDRLSHRTSSG